LTKNTIKVLGILGVALVLYVPVIFFIGEMQKGSTLLGEPKLTLDLLSLLSIVPLVIIVILVFMKFDIVIAGLVGAVLAMVVSSVSFETANRQMIEAMPQVFNDSRLMIDAALAAVFMQTGSYKSSVAFIQRCTNMQARYISIFGIFLLTMSVFLSGNGIGSIFIITPFIFAAGGATPFLMSVCSFVSMLALLLSPLSIEAGIIASAGGLRIADYIVLFMTGFVVFALVGVGVGLYVINRGKKAELGEKVDIALNKMTTEVLFKRIIPLVFLIFALMFGNVINYLFGFIVLSPILYMIGSLILLYLCTPLSVNEVMKTLIDGSTVILPRMFQIALFVGFMNIIMNTGVLEGIAQFVRVMPDSLTLTAAIIVGFLLAVPSGVYIGIVLASILPFVAQLGFLPIELWLVSLGVALGSQLSVANMMVYAHAQGFTQSVLNIIKGNVTWVGMSMGILVIVGTIIRIFI